MVEQLAAERVRGRRKAARRLEIGLARLRVAARVIVSHQDCRAAMLRGVDDDRPQGKIDAARVPLVARQMNAASLVVEVRDPQGLERGIGFCQAGLEELTRAGDAIQDDRDFGTLIPHASKLREAHLPNDRNRVRSGAIFGENGD